VGVAAHQRLTSLVDPGREQGYLPDGFWGHRFVADWALRTHGDPASYAGAVRAAMAKFDRTVLITQMQTMDSVVERAQTSTPFSLLLIAAFAIIAVVWQASDCMACSRRWFASGPPKLGCAWPSARRRAEFSD
jgi:hypothetical protein